MERATIWRRLLASGMDIVVMYCWVLLWASSRCSQTACVVGGYGGILVYSLVEMIFGRSPGKMMLHLRIAQKNGDDAVHSQRVVRWIVRHSPIVFLSLSTAFEIEGVPRSIIGFTDALMWFSGVILFAMFVTSIAIGRRPPYDAILHLDVFRDAVRAGHSEKAECLG